MQTIRVESRAAYRGAVGVVRPGDKGGIAATVQRAHPHRGAVRRLALRHWQRYHGRRGLTQNGAVGDERAFGAGQHAFEIWKPWAA